MMSEYERPALTVDVLLMSPLDGVLKLLLIQRGHAPFVGRWALPGGFVEPNEAPEDAARRELCEETGVVVKDLIQVGGFGAPGRDPRGWTVSLAYLALMPAPRVAEQAIAAADDAAQVAWFPAYAPPEMAFDHADIVQIALERLRLGLWTGPLAAPLLPPAFRLDDIHHLYQILLGRSLDAPTLARRLWAGKIWTLAGPGAYRLRQVRRLRRER
jgi:8-oxo-dGTP diphosphatase